MQHLPCKPKSWSVALTLISTNLPTTGMFSSTLRLAELRWVNWGENSFTGAMLMTTVELL